MSVRVAYPNVALRRYRVVLSAERVSGEPEKGARGSARSALNSASDRDVELAPLTCATAWISAPATGSGSGGGGGGVGGGDAAAL